MVRVGITGYGDRGFERVISRFERHVIREIKRIVAETAEIIASQARALAPVAEIDGGNLRNSIEVKYLNGGLTAVITVTADYAIYVEFGTGIYAENGNGRQDPWVYYDEKLRRYVFTRGMHAQPFFRPGIEAGAEHFEREMRRLG
ncbi:HK97-gp10 family putative phage morphogenesis protein [Bacillus gobiensis]|uniref:HK97-gp10 family putative phage morphogenesis protein n=1 Tax=Bacillus gobiensis TaxID=1441095 RepID=UPI003D24E3C2